MTMKRLTEILFFLLSAMSVAASAQVPAGDVPAAAGRNIEMDGAFLERLQERDSTLIADQLRYGFRLEKVRENTSFVLSPWDGDAISPIEVLSPWIIDTVKVYKGKKKGPSSFDIEGSVIITTFEEGLYTLPPVTMLMISPDAPYGSAPDTLHFKPLSMEVFTIPVDTASFVINDIRGQIRYPLTFKEILPYLAAVWSLVILIVLVVSLIMIRKTRANGATENREPAHIVALRKLDRFRGDRHWEPERQKQFYSGVTDALREYISARWDVGALEMTTFEIFDAMKEKDLPPGLYDEMKKLFERADFVKFAKYTASREENASVIPSAVRFVTATYQEQLDEEASNDSKE